MLQYLLILRKNNKYSILYLGDYDEKVVKNI